MPPGIGIRLTIDGAVFVDARGMTLYKEDVSMPGTAYDALQSCNDSRDAVLLHDTPERSVDFAVKVPDAATRKTCIEKRPPLRAPDGAKPVGDWSIIQRNDGSGQWAFHGEPVYNSTKDKAPGETNGNFSGPELRPVQPWTIASAPLPNAPTAWITAKKTALGLALISTEGRTLYYPEQLAAAADLALWKPLAAPALARADQLPDWSIVTREDGTRQWAHKGRPLYTYVYDAGAETAMNREYGDVFGGTYDPSVRGWRVALLKEAPRHPTGVTVQTLIDGTDFEGERSTSMLKVYANSKGMTMYAFHCVEDTVDRLDCDDVGDSPSYWLSFCGGEDRCKATWRPFVAPAGARAIDDIWSVTAINPRHPWKPLDKDAPGLNVWAYRGKPVFTYARDVRPGDYNGALGLVVRRGAMYASVLPAFDSEDKR